MSGSYLEYKSCTTRFIEWINSAASTILRSSEKLPNTLSALHERTVRITEFPNNILSLGDDLLGKFKEAMLCGFRAIQLRKYVNSLFCAMPTTSLQSEESNANHKHCIKVLKDCYNRLHKWMKSQNVNALKQELRKAPSEVMSSLEEIEVEVETESEAEVEVHAEAENASLQAAAPVSQKTIDEIDEAAGDLRITTLCLLHDMMTAHHQLESIWKDVKLRNKSILTGVAASMVAFRQVSQAHKAMQLKYPSLVNDDDFFMGCFSKALSEDELERLKSSLFVGDLIEVSSLLNDMTTSFAKNLNQSTDRALLLYRRGYFGAPYNEQHGLLGYGAVDYFRFFGAEFPRLYNNYLKFRDGRTDGTAGRDSSSIPSKNRFLLQYLTKEFYDAYIPHFEQGLVTVPQVFLTLCWFQSVRALQDQEFRLLGRNLYYLRKLGRSIDENARRFLNDKRLNDLRKDQDKKLVALAMCTYQQPFGAVMEYLPLHHNPLLQGCIILDKMMNYLHLTTQLMQELGSFHRAAVHLYSGLKQGQYLQEGDIPALESFARVYSPYLYEGGTPPITCGGCETQYLLASNFSALSIAPLNSSTTPSSITNVNGNRNNKEGQRLQPSLLSAVYKCLVHRDMTALLTLNTTTEQTTTATNRTPMETLLQTFVHQMEYELFDSRYLSFKLATYQLEFYSLFQKLRDKIPVFETAYQLNYEEGFQEEKCLAKRHAISLEFGVMKACMLYLDTTEHASNSNGAMILQSVAKAIKKYFEFDLISRVEARKFLSTENETMDSWFHFLPPNASKSNWLAEEFGTISFPKAHDEPQNQKLCEVLFLNLLDACEEAKTKFEASFVATQGYRVKHQEVRQEYFLKSVELEKRVREELKLYPAIASQLEPYSECLCINLLDHAMVGIFPRFDTDFAEWLLQMGGFDSIIKSRATHLQIACIEQAEWALPFLVCENGGLDVDFQNPSDGNTALHYAVLNDNESMALWLMVNANPNTEIRNNDGLRAYDIALAANRRQPGHFGNFFARFSHHLVSQIKAKDEDFKNEGWRRRTIALSKQVHARQKIVANNLKNEERVHTVNSEEMSRAIVAQSSLLGPETQNIAQTTNKKKKKHNKRK